MKPLQQTFQKPTLTSAQAHLRALDDLDIELVQKSLFVPDSIEKEVDYDKELTQILNEAPSAPKLISDNSSAQKRASQSSQVLKKEIDKPLELLKRYVKAEKELPSYLEDESIVGKKGKSEVGDIKIQRDKNIANMCRGRSSGTMGNVREARNAKTFLNTNQKLGISRNLNEAMQTTLSQKSESERRPQSICFKRQNRNNLVTLSQNIVKDNFLTRDRQRRHSQQRVKESTPVLPLKMQNLVNNSKVNNFSELH